MEWKKPQKFSDRMKITVVAMSRGLSIDKARWLRCNLVVVNKVLQDLNLNRLCLYCPEKITDELGAPFSTLPPGLEDIENDVFAYV